MSARSRAPRCSEDEGADPTYAENDANLTWANICSAQRVQSNGERLGHCGPAQSAVSQRMAERYFVSKPTA